MIALASIPAGDLSHRRLLCIWLVAILCGATAPPVSSQGKPTQRGRGGVLWSLDGRTRRVGVRAINAEEIVCQSGTRSTRKVYRLDFDTRRFDVPNRPPDAVVQLVNGDELCLRRLTSNDEVLTGTLCDRRVKVPLEYVRAIVFGDGSSPWVRGAIRTAFSKTEQAEDVVGLANGDRLVGEFVALNTSNLRINVADTERSVVFDRLAFLRFNWQLLSEMPAGDFQVVVELSGGSVLTGNRLSEPESSDICIRTAWGGNVVIPSRRMMSVRFLSKRIQRLAEVSPMTFHHKPFVGRQREYHVNRTINRDYATHKRQRFFNSLGVTSGMSLTWQLDGAYSGFHSRFGIDDSAANGAAVFVIRVDGQERYRSPAKASGEPAGFTGLIDVSGAKTLTLAVEYGPRGDLHDVANWLDPVLIRK